MANINRSPLDDFFDKYEEFLRIDAIACFYGRDYNLIKHFYNLFLDISQEANNEVKIINSREKLENIFNQYKEHNKSCLPFEVDVSRLQGNLVPIRNALRKGYALSNAFLLLVNSIKQYETWRSKLSAEAIRVIYLKNLQDGQKYYLKEIPQEINELLAKCSPGNNFILRQTLIEFHNAMSHLNAAYKHIGDAQTNTSRAIAHFKRGALDSYKAIIRDFCLLSGNNPLPQITKQLQKLRKHEYQSMGNDRERDKIELYKEYKQFTDLIIESIQRQ
ncbi:hypothetical protein CQA49_08925 [Helicobacter sp. MIT 00-7814]|uniref:hypothetical protein n=1 Tax=unclassified Helicobacter TaxID=2593540 RepID=UPI000E1E8175|nr:MULTISPECIES: hypothetical protein [unclassified Helicobacter]RDU51951.1 hypothetical protein CQA49_08925 [Helicobacter sp. MIT 00-7814]RDU54121.1 hypothetical protein CQA37_05780 [Helicobacter sp. MIT 99-10781]